MKLDIKKIVEDQLGYEVDDENFDVEPIFEGSKFVGIDIKV